MYFSVTRVYHTYCDLHETFLLILLATCPVECFFSLKVVSGNLKLLQCIFFQTRLAPVVCTLVLFIKVVRIVGLSLFPLLCLQQIGSARWNYVTIPYSNCSQSIKDSWFVPISTLVPTTNAKSLTPLFRGDSEIWARLG